MATAQQHNKYLAMSHLGFGVSGLILLIGSTWFLYVMWGIKTMDPAQAKFMLVGLMIVNGMNFLFIAPSFVAGWALLQRKKWAKIASLIAALAGFMYLPLGPLVSGYSLWFFINEPGRILYK